MPGSQHGPSIKNPRVYEALRRKGMSKQRAARISNAQKESGTTGLAIPPHGANALFNTPGVGGTRARRRLKRRAKAFNWGAHAGETISGALGRDRSGRFTNSGGQSAARSGRLTDAQRKRREEMRAKRQARADARAAAHAAEEAQEESKRAEEDAYIAAGATGAERQRRRAEVATARRARAAATRERHRQEAAEERQQRQQEDQAEAQTRAQEAQQSGGGGGGGGKKKPTEEQQQAERDKKKAENRTKTAPKAGLSSAEASALAAVAGGGSAGSTDTSRLRSMGLLDDSGVTDAGRRLLNALERGDVRGALAAIQDGRARVAREQARRTTEQTRTQQRQAREQSRRRQQQQRDEERRKRDAERRAAQQRRDAERRQRDVVRRAHTTQQSFGYNPRRTTPAPAADASTTRERSRTLAAQIIRNLEERRQRRRKEVAQTTFGGTTRGKLPDSAFAGPDRSFPIMTAQDVRDAVRSLGRTKHDKAAVRRGIIRRARAIGAVDALPESWRSEKAVRTFTVFKDAQGRDRWAAITTTAYEDNDQEWISCKAIRAVVAAGDAAPSSRGPLRFWHVPGLDLGDCDYQAAIDDGRLLLESGTFRSSAAARIGQKAAQLGYQMSPGFLHTRREPRAGVFDHIVIFERSFVPPGRASNPYTRLLTKEARMLADEKRKEFEVLAGDDEGRALLQSLLATAQATTKAADEAGAVYKDAPAWAQALITRIDALEAREKAAPPPPAAEEADPTAVLDADLGLGDEPAVADEGAADMLDDDGFADLIVQKVVAALGPMLELEKKMTGYLGEMKAMLQSQPAQQQKDDARAKELADLAAANVTLEARLKALEGDQPRGLHASVWGSLTGIAIDPAQAAAITAKQAPDIPAGLNEQERGAYALIFGEQ